MHHFVVNRPLAVLFSLVVLAVPALVLHATARPTRRSIADVRARRRAGLGALVIGADGRASTSKVQAVLWTFAVMFAIVFLLFWGRSAGCGDSTGARCRAAHTARAAFSNFVNRGLQPEYYVLLGFPVTAAIAAKAITTAKIADKTLVKDPLRPEEGQGGFLQAVREVVNNDIGEADLLDTQYFAFNLLTLGFFFAQFLTNPAAGLPDLPATLIALSGLSAAGYTTKKALATTGAVADDPAPTGAGGDPPAAP